MRGKKKHSSKTKVQDRSRGWKQGVFALSDDCSFEECSIASASVSVLMQMHRVNITLARQHLSLCCFQDQESLESCTDLNDFIKKRTSPSFCRNPLFDPCNYNPATVKSRNRRTMTSHFTKPKRSDLYVN